MRTLKKTVAMTLLSALLMTGFAFAVPFSASAAYDNNPTFSITGTNTTPPASTHSGVYLFTNTGSSAKTIYWNNYNFRYSKLMIFNSAGRIVECGGDLYSDSSTITGAPQLSVTIPAGGFMVAFGHNNSGLMKAYDVVMEGAMLYNSTMSVIYELYGSYSGGTLTIRYNNPKAPSASAKKFLFVGNSTTYFNGSPIKFKAMAAAAGIEVDVTYCTVGSSFLEWFADENHTAGKQFRSLLNTKKFDYVVFQDAASANYDRTKPAIDKMMPLVKANGAQALLYMRYSAASTVDQIRTNAIKHHNNYTKISRDLGLVCAPIADAFVHYAEKYNDPTTLYASDGGHHSKEGSYLIAATWLYSYLGVNPVGNTYTADLSSSMVSKLQACAKIAVEEGYPYPGQEPTYVENGVTYKNIALEKKYDVNGSVYTGAWTDESKTKYTDGIIAIDGSDTANGCWKGKTVDVTIKLEERYDLKNIRVDMYGNSGWGLVDPVNFQVKVAVSDNGTTFTDIGTATIGEEKVNGDWKFREFNLVTGKDDLSARFVRLTFSNKGDPAKDPNFFWLSEIRVFGKKSADQSGIPNDTTPEKSESLVFGKEYTSLTAPNRDTFLDDGKVLTNGVKGEINVNQNGVYAGWNAPDATQGFSVELLFDLESAKKSDTYTAYMAGGNWGIALPKDVISMEVYASDNADSGFELVADAPVGSAVLTNTANNWSTYTITATADEAVSARYIKVVLTHEPVESNDGKAYIWVDEVEVLSTIADDSFDPEVSEPETPNGNNVALNKDYEGGNPSSAGGYTADLTDGVASDKEAYDSNWFALYYHKDATSDKINAPDGIGTIIIDLEEVVDGINSIRVHVWNHNKSGIASAKSIKAFISEDGETYTELADLVIPASDAPAWAAVNADNVSARYVKLVIETQAVWTFLNEIEVIADPNYTPDGDVSDPEVSDPEIEVDLGDIDEDGDVDAADYVLVKRAVLKTYELSETQKTVADIDADGDVDATDYVLVKRIVLGTYKAK